MGEFLNTNKLFIKNLWTRRSIFAIAAIVLISITIFMDIINIAVVNDYTISLSSVLISFCLIFFLIGINVIKSLKKITTINTHFEIKDDKKGFLKLGLFAKNIFWNTFIIWALLYILNYLNVLIPQPISYIIFDLLFFVVVIYGSEAAWYMNIFSRDLTEYIMSKQGEKNE